MAKIRVDLEGSVMVAGQILRAGDSVPTGARVHEWVLAPVRKRKGASDEPVGDS